MRKMAEVEIKTTAKHIVDSWLAGYSLPNAKKISQQVKRLLLEEENRRKQLQKVRKVG